jgi:AcrR family transcriptional regulator
VTRRRGPALTRAIFQATLEELADTSFEELSFDRIAARAGTGKSALYRRWSTPAELVLAALTDPRAGLGEPVAPATGTLRGDLLVLLTAFARMLDEPHGRALRPLLTQRPRHPELFDQVMELVKRPHHEVLLDCLRAAAGRGEADPRRVSMRVASVGPRMIVFESMERGRVPDGEVEALVDEVLLPLIAPVVADRPRTWPSGD